MRTVFHSLLCAPAARMRWRGVFAALVIAILWLALTPHPPTSIDLGWDKLNHACAFASLAFSGWLSWRGGPRRRWMLALALLALGAGIEIVQSQVPGRDAEWGDLAADSVGIIAGLVVATLAVSLTLARPARR